MKWKLPHISKVYEALGAIADRRLELLRDQVSKSGPVSAKVYSSSRNKFYDVSYDPDKKAIMSNDNSAYWKGELGYPAIALLMLRGVLPFDKEITESLKGIAWKDVNQKHKNDFDKTVEEVLVQVDSIGYPVSKSGELREFCEEVLSQIAILDLGLLGAKQKPPEGY